MIVAQVAQKIDHFHQPMILDHGDSFMVTDQDLTLDHQTDIADQNLKCTNILMIDIKPKDHKVVIGSIKIIMIIPDTMAICMGDHKVIHLKGTIIDNIIVMKTITLHVNSGRATKIETKEGLIKQLQPTLE